MMPEVQENPKVRNMLAGASIIVHTEKDVTLLAALGRSKIAEETNDIDSAKTLDLVDRVRKELELNGGAELNNEQSRMILRHMLKDQPTEVSSKLDPILGI